VWVALGIVVGAHLASGGTSSASRAGGLHARAEILTLLVGLSPFIAFLSMRQEVSSGTVEHLMLSKLSPGAVVRGKLAAAVVQIVVVISLFAPLLALTWLLRGVDVRTIAALLTLALIAGISAVSVGICGGALCRWPPARAIFVVILALGFTLVSITAMGGMGRWSASPAQPRGPTRVAPGVLVPRRGHRAP
jgi:ABC-type transport system involved in cytochrome c biogenesis permease component